MLYDPGAARSVITKKVWLQIGYPKLKSAGTLVAHSGVAVDTMGKTKVEVEAFGKRKPWWLKQMTHLIWTGVVPEF